HPRDEHESSSNEDSSDGGISEPKTGVQAE
ncbi:hypothetical protein AVEN_98833-1, partial [Araneus ventricosus]